MRSTLSSRNDSSAKIITALIIIQLILLILSLLLSNTPASGQVSGSKTGEQISAPNPVMQVSQRSDLRTFWSLTKLGGGISLVIFAVLALGVFLISLQLYELLVDKHRSRVLLSVRYDVLSMSEVRGLVNQYSNNLTARLYSVLLSIFGSTGNTRDFHDEIANYIQSQQDRFATFKSRLTFLSDTAGALGLLGTVWGMFLTFFGGNLDSQRILNGMGLALVTTLIGLVVSIILNFCATEVFSFFNKRIELISSKADEFRLWLMSTAHKRDRSAGTPAAGSGAPRSSHIEQRRPSQAPAHQASMASLTLKAISDSKQDGFIGQTLTEPIIIEVETTHGRKVTGVPIRFEISEGGGLLEHRHSVAWVKTGKKGIAKMVWTMGRQVGPQKLRVSILNDKNKQLEFVSFAKPTVSHTVDLEREVKIMTSN